MAFELKNRTGEILKSEFPQQEDQRHGFKEESFSWPIPDGTIRGSQWTFDGIKISYAEFNSDKKAILDWSGNSELVTMHFNLAGKISMTDNSIPREFTLSNNQHNMFYGSGMEGQIIVNDRAMKNFLIQFSPDHFLSLAENGNDSIKKFADAVDKKSPSAFSDKNLSINAPLLNCIHSVLNCDFSSSLKKMFLFSKTIEMLVLQAESLQYKANDKLRYVKKEFDRERIQFVRDYVAQHADRPPSLAELSRMAGINEYKLKRGFKEAFNLTVFEYVSNLRMESALSELQAKTKSISQIAFELGYCSVQHFSNAFKKKFGIPPSKSFA